MAREMKTGQAYARSGVADHGAETIIRLLRAQGHRDELGRGVPDPAAGPPTGPPVTARLNHGRWIGDCNSRDATRNRTCLNAQLLHPGDPRFFCVECFNEAAGGAWRPVAWPPDRAVVESPLLALPAPEQNWAP